ncbi:hypothetical protein DFJ74DRAFT_77067 [Hyaloraphidium curvatum]|nr:hypothetical protein DFJ74DRAFT_77067 [Hyaloraphidium curvatum]
MASSIDPPSEAAASADACSICLQDLERRGGRPIINPGCGHELHLACFHQLLQANPAAACPVCRKPLGAGVPSQGLPQTFVRNVAPVAPPPLQAPQQMAMPRLFQGPQQIRSFGYGNRARTLDHERDFADTLPSTHDPALDDPVAPAPDAHRPAGTYDYSQIVRLKLDAESDPVTAEATKLTTMVSLTVGPDPNESEDRNAIDLVVVVDKSGSMSGSKITQVKDTLRYILETLSPLDRVSIVLFDFTAKMLCGLKRLTPSGKAELGLLINRIDAGGGTTIAGGLSLALDVVEKRLQKNSSSAILLLSDGQDSPGSGGAVSPYERLKQRAQLASSPVFSYGIGNDHDANCLTTLACQGGTFTFVDNMEMVRSAFAGAIGALKGIAVKDCLLTLKLPAQLGGTFSKVLSGYPVERQDATTVVVKFADAYYEEERCVECCNDTGFQC